ncbi:MAG: DUF397 domain-containing protein [Pseudonocardiales bacterium]|nr:DUF397 domain-containing protein [Pseudonocardiales bacterium]MBV9032434.1 DUF397 domain-containing protein [Pseudonocardiales bacterium]
MVEVPPPPATASWRKSRVSGDPSGNCVEVTGTQGHVWVRDSKDPLGPALGLTREGWSAFLVGVQRDELDRSGVPV